MKTIIACFVIAISLMSFQSTPPKVYHYPDIMVVYEKAVPANCETAFEFYLNGKFVSSADDYFLGIDSVAVKYLRYNSNKSKHTTTYTNFYSRKSESTWNKYNGQKVATSIVSEHRTDTLCVSKYSAQATIIYYRVR